MHASPTSRCDEVYEGHIARVSERGKEGLSRRPGEGGKNRGMKVEEQGFGEGRGIQWYMWYLL